MVRSVLAVSGCGLALGASLHASSTFLAQQSPIHALAHKDPTLYSDMKKIQDNGGDKGYHMDYPADSRPNETAGERSWTHVTVEAPGSGPRQGSTEWYVAECKKINDHCTFIHGHRRKSVEEDLRFLEDEYLREKGILDEKKEKHIQEKADITRINEEIDECKITIKENSECPAELSSAQRELSALQAIRDKTPSDIDRECEVEKEVIKWQKCVDELRAAEALLIKHTESLPKEQRQVVRAEKKIPDQEDVVKEAKARWLAAQANGVDPASHSVEANCDKERDELMKELNGRMKDLWRYYVEQKGIFEGKEDTHRAEKADVREQKEDVVQITMKVSEAEAAVKEKAHCEPKLQAAEAKLAQLVRVPDRSTSDIDDECEVEKEVIELKACVKVLNEAKRVLRGHRETHSVETADLATQESEATAARVALPPQEKVVEAAYEAWLRAKAMRDAANCYPDEQ